MKTQMFQFTCSCGRRVSGHVPEAIVEADSDFPVEWFGLPSDPDCGRTTIYKPSQGVPIS
jgi:hypothetical protein